MQTSFKMCRTHANTHNNIRATTRYLQEVLQHSHSHHMPHACRTHKWAPPHFTGKQAPTTCHVDDKTHTIGTCHKWTPRHIQMGPTTSHTHADMLHVCHRMLECHTHAAIHSRQIMHTQALQCTTGKLVLQYSTHKPQHSIYCTACMPEYTTCKHALGYTTSEPARSIHVLHRLGSIAKCQMQITHKLM